MESNLEAYASNPRYAPEGLETEIENEELMEARKVDTQQATQVELDNIAKPDMTGVPSMDPAVNKAEDESLAIRNEQKASLEKDNMIQMHEGVLNVVTAATRMPVDIVGGLTKATDSALSLVVGRENLDASNQFLLDNFPGLTKFTSDYEKGIAPEGTVSKVTQELAQFIGPFGVYMKGLGALNAMTKAPVMGTFTKALTADVLASGTALNPHMERLSSLAKSAGVENEFIGWLADNSDETESMGRLKNMIENSALGVSLQATLGPVFMSMKALYRGSKATVEAVTAKPKEFKKFEIDENAENFGMPELKTLEETDSLLKETIGNTAPERVQFREEAIKTFTSEAKPSKNPTVTFMGGGGASGKGSVSNQVKRYMPKDAVTIDPDTIKQVIPEYDKIIKAGDERAAKVVHEESSQIAKDAVTALIDKKANAVIDVTLGNVESGLKKIKEFKEAGYKVNLVGVTIDPGEAVSRAVSRALETKRSVPIGPLLEGHKGFSKGFEEYVRLVDEGVLMDNSGKTPVAIALIKNGKLERLNEKAYTTFRSKGDLNEKARKGKHLYDAGGSEGGKEKPLVKEDAKADTGKGVQQSESGKDGARDGLDEVSKKLDKLLKAAKNL